MRKEQIPLIDRVDSLERKNQILTVAGIVLSLFANGNIMGFSSMALPELLNSDTTIKPTHEDLSNIASFVLIGSVLGTLTGGVVSDLIGRKRTLIISSIFYSIGWIIITQSEFVIEILIGRILTGFAAGFYSATVQVYICEIVSPDIRGISCALPTLMVSIGILTIYCLGSILTWRQVSVICSIFPLFVLSYVVFLPESPIWLINHEQKLEALKSLSWLRNDAEEAERECMHLQYLRERRASRSTKSRFSLMKKISRMSEYSVLKPLFIGCIIFFFQQFSGIYPITFYATFIFAYADNINDYLETISIGIVRVFANLIAIFLVTFVKRRTLLIASGLLMCGANAVLGGIFYVKHQEFELDDLANSTFLMTSNSRIKQFLKLDPSSIFNGSEIEFWPLVCLLIFMFGYSVGFGIIPWILAVELMPSDVKSLCCSLALGFNQFCLFTTVKSFLGMMENFETYGTFWFYSAVAFFSVIFVALFVPETSDMHVGDIEDIFEEKNSLLSPEEEEEVTTF